MQKFYFYCMHFKCLYYLSSQSQSKQQKLFNLFKFWWVYLLSIQFSYFKSTLEGYVCHQLFFWKVPLGPATFARGRIGRARSLLCTPHAGHAQGAQGSQPYCANPSTSSSSLRSFQVGRNIGGLRRNFQGFVHILFFCYKCHLCFLCFSRGPLESLLLCCVQNLHTQLLLLPKGILTSFIAPI